MQPEFLERLAAPTRAFVQEVEAASGMDIVVIPTPRLNGGGPFRQGYLEVEVRAREVRLYAPTHGYFPDGAVVHEVLHVKRCHVDGVPQLVLAASVPWDDAVMDMLSGLDNALEHLVIVPQELQRHPERREHWQALMHGICSGMADIPPEQLNLAVCLHWTFLRHVLPDSPPAAALRKYANERGLFDMADQFADCLLAVLDSKEGMVRLLFESFPQIGRKRAGLDYINSAKPTRHQPIP